MKRKLLIAILVSAGLIACKHPAEPEQPEEPASEETVTAETETAEPETNTAEEQTEQPAEQPAEEPQSTEETEPFEGLPVEENAVYEVQEDTEIIIE